MSPKYLRGALYLDGSRGQTEAWSRLTRIHSWPSEEAGLRLGLHKIHRFFAGIHGLFHYGIRLEWSERNAIVSKPKIGISRFYFQSWKLQAVLLSHFNFRFFDCELVSHSYKRFLKSFFAFSYSSNGCIPPRRRSVKFKVDSFWML